MFDLNVPIQKLLQPMSMRLLAGPPCRPAVQSRISWVSSAQSDAIWIHALRFARLQASHICYLQFCFSVSSHLRGISITSMCVQSRIDDALWDVHLAEIHLVKPKRDYFGKFCGLGRFFRISLVCKLQPLFASSAPVKSCSAHLCKHSSPRTWTWQEKSLWLCRLT